MHDVKHFGAWSGTEVAFRRVISGRDTDLVVTGQYKVDASEPPLLLFRVLGCVLRAKGFWLRVDGQVFRV